MLDNCASHVGIRDLPKCVHHSRDVAVEDEIERNPGPRAVRVVVVISVEKELWFYVQRVRKLLKSRGANAVDPLLVFLDLLEG